MVAVTLTNSKFTNLMQFAISKVPVIKQRDLYASLVELQDHNMVVTTRVPLASVFDAPGELNGIQN
jgi:hypothetical protein